MTDWQPIETAPRNGTRVLLGRVGCVEPGAWDPTYRCRRDAAPGAWRGDDGGGPEDDTWPTHWMPLPEPPK